MKRFECKRCSTPCWVEFESVSDTQCAPEYCPFDGEKEKWTEVK
jgi:hypothetical protein